VVLATTESVKVRYHTYEGVTFHDYLAGLTGKSAVEQVGRKKFKHPNPHIEPEPLKKSELCEGLTMKEVIRILSLHLDENSCVISDVGDAIFGAVGIRTSKR